MYRDGQGVPQDNAEAIRLFQEAAANVPFIGIAPSQQTLSVVVTKNTTFLFSEPAPFPNVKAGSAGSTGPITVSSLDGFSGTVQLSCAGTYPADSCYVTPSSVNVGGNPVSVNVTIAATGVEQSQAVVTGTSGAITQTINIPFNVGKLRNSSVEHLSFCGCGWFHKYECYVVGNNLVRRDRAGEL